MDTKLDAGSWVNIQNVENLDMSKYSYYPIKIEDTIVNVNDIKLKFNNENIEKQEKIISQHKEVIQSILNIMQCIVDCFCIFKEVN